MPLVLDESDELPEGERASLPDEPAPGPAPSLGQTFGAAFRSQNVGGMIYDRLKNPEPSTPAAPGFDPLSVVPAGYEQFADRFLDADSPEQVNWIKGRIDQETADRQTIQRAGGWGVAATLAAGATDPLTIASMAIPVGGEVGLLARGARMAAVAAGTSAAQEGVAQALQQTRTAGESLTNVGTSAILGGILGAVIRPRVPAGEFAQLREGMDAAAAVPHEANPSGASTAGAAAVATPTLADNTLAGPGKTLAEGLIGKASPGLRLLSSPSPVARDLVQQLAETHEVLNKNLQGVATPTAVETALRGYEGDWWQAWKARGQAFQDYRTRVAQEGGDALSRGDFMQQVAYAMRRDDSSDIPEIADAAAKTRTIVFDPLKERAQKLGLLPEDLETTGADSYLMRQYDAAKINANLPDWTDTLVRGFMHQGVDSAEARDAAQKVTDNILASERGTMDWHVLDDAVPRSGRLKERTLTLPDTLLEPYLNSDIDHLTHSYLRTLAPEVEMTERFGAPDIEGIRRQYQANVEQLGQMTTGEHGIPEEAAGQSAGALRAQMRAQVRQAQADARNLKPQLEAVRDDYGRLMEQARASGKADAMAALMKQRDRDIEDLSAIRDRLYGIYGQPKDPSKWYVRAGRFLRSANAVRLLGAATLAHVPDIANVITHYGLPNTLRALTRLGTSWGALQLTRAEARRMGVGMDMVMNHTAALLGDYASHSRFAEQRFMRRLTRGFTIATGETPLITAIQSLASAIGQDEILRAAQSPGKLSARELTRLASAGIDRDMLGRIAAEAREHGREVNDLHFGMSDQWKDREAAKAFEGAVVKAAHAMTLSPGAGDMPLFMSNELAKAVFQFTSFAYAASRHVLMPIAQGVAAGDVRAMTGLLSLVAAGYASYWAKQKAAGQPVESQDMGRLALEVLDKTNLMGWTGSVIYPALWQLGFKDFSRWSDRDATETLLGPVAGTIASIYNRRLPARLTASGEGRDQPFSRSDLHFIRRLMPGQNLWYARRAVNGLEDSIGDLFNLPGESESQKERGEMVAANQ